MSGFTRIDQSSAAQWGAIAAEHMDHYRNGAVARIIRHLRMLAELELGFACNQLHHALMTGTLARQAGADAETVVTALCHDIGKTLSVPNHPAIGAAFLQPYVSDDHYRAVLHHQDYQGAYYYGHFGLPTDLRDAHAGASWDALARRIVDEWDMPAFDPDFAVDPLDSFVPEIKAVFSEPRMM